MSPSLKQSKHYDHKTPFSELVAIHPTCLLEKDYRPHWADDGALDCGAIHFPVADGRYSSFAYAPDGWVYFADTSMGDHANYFDKYVPVNTAWAVRFIEANARSVVA